MVIFRTLLGGKQRRDEDSGHDVRMKRFVGAYYAELQLT